MKHSYCELALPILLRVILLAAVLAPPVLGQAPTTKPQVAHNIPWPDFKYVIVYNDPPMGKAGRQLYILMDPSEFSEANLRKLSKLLNQRFENVSRYVAYVETSLQDLQTPEEHEGPGYSETTGNPKAGKTPAATMRHSAEADTLYIFSPTRGAVPTKVNLRIPPDELGGWQSLRP